MEGPDQKIRVFLWVAMESAKDPNLSMDHRRMLFKKLSL